jgi:hypothetical protein
MNPSGPNPSNDTGELGQDDQPLRQARLELSELQSLIADIADPDRRQQLARSARRRGAYLHARHGRLRPDAPGARRRTVTACWPPSCGPGPRPAWPGCGPTPPTTTWPRPPSGGPDGPPTWPLTSPGGGNCCEHHSDCPEPGGEVTESGERYYPAHFPDPPVNILDRT